MVRKYRNHHCRESGKVPDIAADINAEKPPTRVRRSEDPESAESAAVPKAQKRKTRSAKAEAHRPNIQSGSSKAQTRRGQTTTPAKAAWARFRAV